MTSSWILKSSFPGSKKRNIFHEPKSNKSHYVRSDNILKRKLLSL
jgi:hypothetical protein